jgi:hypothetical protein
VWQSDDFLCCRPILRARWARVAGVDLKFTYFPPSPSPPPLSPRLSPPAPAELRGSWVTPRKWSEEKTAGGGGGRGRDGVTGGVVTAGGREGKNTAREQATEGGRGLERSRQKEAETAGTR